MRGVWEEILSLRRYLPELFPEGEQREPLPDQAPERSLPAKTRAPEHVDGEMEAERCVLCEPGC